MHDEAMKDEALPLGTRLRGGALLIEEVLGREDKAFLYRAYDVPARREVVLSEYFPDGAGRHARAVAPPLGWSATGFEIARNKFLTGCINAIFTFEENDTLYAAFEYSAGCSAQKAPEGPNLRATVALTSTSIAPPTTLPIPTPALREGISSSSSSTKISKPRQTFSLSDVLPDALRGAGQGAIAGAVSGVLLGVIAALAGDGDIVSGAARGLLMLPVGALAGALLGVLRALPSSAPQLASASPRTRADQIQSTLAGAGKGAIAGIMFGGVFLLLLIAGLGGEASLFSLAKAAILFTLSGAFAGAIVGFIRINPRDRSHH
jgi:hypothetical protein